VGRDTTLVRDKETKMSETNPLIGTNQSQFIEVQEAEFIPAAIAQKCPVCNGFGTLRHGDLICHGCTGKGYVLVPTQKNERESA
jgi:DnaJ-class molecular chaperone